MTSYQKITHQLNRNDTAQRVSAVASLVPLFSVLLSDVIIYISTDSFASVSKKSVTPLNSPKVKFEQQMKKLASLIGKVHNFPPHLILIQNKCNAEEVLDYEEMTPQWLALEQSRLTYGFRYSYTPISTNKSF